MILPNRAVETFVKDYKIENGLEKPKNEDKSLPGQTLELSNEVRQKLFELQQKGIDINQLILDMLQKRDKSSLPIHHTARFALTKSHNPFFLAPLCEDHHTIAHSIDVKFQEKRFRGT